MTVDAVPSRSNQLASVDLLEIDPDLFAGVDPAEVADARHADALWVDIGHWEPDALGLGQAGDFGLLVLDGILLRRTALRCRDGLELLGPGDVLRPWAAGWDHSDLGVRPTWSVHRRARLALLNADFSMRVARWPVIAGELMDRLVRRQYGLGVQLSITHIPNLQLRLRLMLWSLAARWGRVTRDGVRVDVALTHQLLADLAGASRPPVTTALGQLERNGSILRDATGRWVLRGLPPEELLPPTLARDSPDGEAEAARVLG